MMLSFVFSFDDYVLSAFTAGGTTQTWPMVVFAAVRFGVTPAINAFATLMLLVTLSVPGRDRARAPPRARDRPCRGRPR